MSYAIRLQGKRNWGRLKNLAWTEERKRGKIKIKRKEEEEERVKDGRVVDSFFYELEIAPTTVVDDDDDDDVDDEECLVVFELIKKLTHVGGDVYKTRRCIKSGYSASFGFVGINPPTFGMVADAGARGSRSYVQFFKWEKREGKKNKREKEREGVKEKERERERVDDPFVISSWRGPLDAYRRQIGDALVTSNNVSTCSVCQSVYFSFLFFFSCIPYRRASRYVSSFTATSFSLFALVM